MKFEFDPATMEKKADYNCTLMIGRFQPFHLGHKFLFEDAFAKIGRVVIACIHSGKKSERAPFSREDVRRLIQDATPANVDFFSNGYLPEIVSYYRKSGFEINRMVCGPDRVDTFRAQIDRENKKFTDECKLDIVIESPDRRYVGEVSATKIRSYLENDDRENFAKNMPPCLSSNFDYLRAELLACK